MSELFSNLPTIEKIEKKNLKEILGRFPNQKIAVVGDVGVDKYTVGDVDRISPEAPVPVLKVSEELRKLGLAANVAENLKTMEADPLLIGVIGQDRNGEDFYHLLNQAHLESSGIVSDPKRHTCFKERVVARGQQVVRIDYESTDDLSDSEVRQIELRCQDWMNKQTQGGALLIEDYRKGVVSRRLVEHICALSKEKKTLVGVDPNRETPLSVYRGVDFLTPNLQEAEALVRAEIRTSEELIQAGEKILKETKAKFVMITLGKYGMAFFDGEEVRRIPTYAKEVFDVSGAGDTALATITLAVLSGASLSEAATLANLASGIVVGKQGTATVKIEEIQKVIDLRWP